MSAKGGVVAGAASSLARDHDPAPVVTPIAPAQEASAGSAGDRHARLIWLVRRIGRMTWREVPYRVHGVLRAACQSRGLFTASRVPQQLADARFGEAWYPALGLPGQDAAVDGAAAAALDGRLAIFGSAVPFASGLPDWNADPVTGTRIALDFGLSIDFRHIGNGVDIKHLWELNRHLWLVPLAQAWHARRHRASLDRLGQLLRDWLDSNPYALGANWSSPVEHGIRLINWSLIWHLAGGNDSELFEGEAGRDLRERWLASVFQHMRFASDNYSFHSSADNHLIGEAAGVYVAGHTWDCWSEGRGLRERAKAILEHEALAQFSTDGVNLEQALCYHKFSLQFLLAAGLCARANGDDFGAPFWQRVEAAVAFLAAMTDAAGNVPKFGDSDDGDVWRLHPGAETNGFHEVLALGAGLFANPPLRAKCRALGIAAQSDSRQLADPADLQRLPRAFACGGYALLGRRLHDSDELRVLVDCGPLGYNRIAGHGHADALSVLVSASGEELLVDPGTYCYNAAPALRHFFRGTTAHNTLVIDGQDQSIYGASFLWLRDIHTTIERLDASGGGLVHAHHDGYMRLRDPVRHHRRVTLGDDDTIQVEDWLDCAQPHPVQLLWHCATSVNVVETCEAHAWQLDGRVRSLSLQIVAGSAARSKVVCGSESPVQGWVSPAFYVRRGAPVLVVDLTLAPHEVVRTSMRLLPRAAGAAA